MKRRGKWQGMITIALFNWPYYLAAGAVLVATLGGLLLSQSTGMRLIYGVALGGAVYFLVGSLGVSHLIYDRSDLYRFGWIDRALHGVHVNHAIFCHSGFDETSLELREKLGNVGWQNLDHFDETQMTEASIRRARRRYPPVEGTLRAPYGNWPIRADAADVIFGLLAIHELRNDLQRASWFGEAKRSLHADGCLVLVEHIRDAANFLAFGPGFLHFHSRESWRRAWESAGFRPLDEFRITPWVRVFVLSPK